MLVDDIEEMRCLPLFAGVDGARIEDMLRTSFLQRFPAHMELAREGDPANYLHVIVEGQVEMYSAHRDRGMTISVVGPGHSFIVAAVILDTIYLKSARALLSSHILLIPAEAVRRYFREDAAFSRTLALELAGAYRGVVREVKNQKLRSSIERLANWILSCDVEKGGNGRFELPFGKKVLASRLGMTPEALSRTIAALIPYGVEVSGRAIEIRDRRSLHRLACPSPTIDETVSFYP